MRIAHLLLKTGLCHILLMLFGGALRNHASA